MWRKQTRLRDKRLEITSFTYNARWIFSYLPLSKQVLAVSATYPEALANLVSRYMQNPAFVRLGQEQPTLLGVKQFACRSAFHPLTQQQWKNKLDKLLQILKKVLFSQCMVFTNLQTRYNKHRSHSILLSLDISLFLGLKVWQLYFLPKATLRFQYLGVKARLNAFKRFSNSANTNAKF